MLADKGHVNLAETVKNRRIIYRSEFCCGYDFAGWDGFLGLFQGLGKALDVDGDLKWEAWREKAMKQYKEDNQLKALVREHRHQNSPI